MLFSVIPAEAGVTIRETFYERINIGLPGMASGEFKSFFDDDQFLGFGEFEECLQLDFSGDV